jgi:16S rRNA pseudouridine516 synthase
MMNKPAGVVSATKDHSNPTAIDLIYEHRNDQLQIAGRLDIDTTGLLLITDDGQWNHIVTSPRTDCKKIYLVELENPVGEDYQRKLEAGIALEGEKRRCLPATMEVIDEHHIRLTISEGKYHQVKRMMTSLGNEVVSLHRMQIGGIELDSELGPGDYRPLTDEEIASIQ